MVGLAPFSGKKKKAGASHLLSPTMSDSEIGGEPAIRRLGKRALTGNLG